MQFVFAVRVLQGFKTYQRYGILNHTSLNVTPFLPSDVQKMQGMNFFLKYITVKLSILAMKAGNYQISALAEVNPHHASLHNSVKISVMGDIYVTNEAV